MYVYGSYARGKENEYSDLDLYIELSKQKRKEKINKRRIANYLENELGLMIDININEKPQTNKKII